MGMSGNTIDSYAQKIEAMTQYVIEERPGNFRAMTYSPVSFGPHYFPRMAIDDQIANLITAQLLFLESSDPKKDIIMYVNSPGVRFMLVWVL